MTLAKMGFYSLNPKAPSFEILRRECSNGKDGLHRHRKLLRMLVSTEGGEPARDHFLASRVLRFLALALLIWVLTVKYPLLTTINANKLRIISKLTVFNQLFT